MDKEYCQVDPYDKNEGNKSNEENASKSIEKCEQSHWNFYEKTNSFKITLPWKVLPLQYTINTTTVHSFWEIYRS